MTATPGCRLVARKGLPRAHPGLIVNESSGFADGIDIGRDGAGIDSRMVPEWGRGGIREACVGTCHSMSMGMATILESFDRMNVRMLSRISEGLRSASMRRRALNTEMPLW